MMNWVVGAMNWMNPRLDRDIRRAAQAKVTRGATVAGPARASNRPASGWAIWPWPVDCSHRP